MKLSNEEWEQVNSQLEHRIEILLGAFELLQVGMNAVIESRERILDENEQLKLIITTNQGETH